MIKNRERRQFPRIKAPVVFRYKSPLSGPTVATDISRGGLRMYSDELLEVGKELSLDILLDEKTTVSFHGRVVWKKRLGPRFSANYDIGIEFLDITEEQQKLLGGYLENFGKRKGS